MFSCISFVLWILHFTLNTFYMWLYRVRHMVKDHSDCEKGNSLLPQVLPFLISSRESYMHHPTDRTARTTALVTLGVEQLLK